MANKRSVPNRQYTDEFKVEAVRVGESVGGNKAAARWSVPESSVWNWIGLSRAGKLRAVNETAGPVKRPIAEVEVGNPRLRRELANTKLDLEIVKNRPRGFPRPICVEAGGGYTGRAPGQWPTAFWRRMSPFKNLAQGKLRTELWWHDA
jgi:transposase